MGDREREGDGCCCWDWDGTAEGGAGERGTGTGTDAGVRSGPSSPSASLRVARAVVGASSGAELGNGSGGNAVSASAALVASQRILALATENLDMTRNVTGVMKESLDRADAYVLSLFSLFFSFSFAEPFVDELAVCAQ